jgi:hypothetical protein
VQLTARLDALGPPATERLLSDSYLFVVRKAFRFWDQGDRGQKRDYIGKLLVNDAANRFCGEGARRGAEYSSEFC